jgi:hypothetical protein
VKDIEPEGILARERPWRQAQAYPYRWHGGVPCSAPIPASARRRPWCLVPGRERPRLHEIPVSRRCPKLLDSPDHEVPRRRKGKWGAEATDSFTDGRADFFDVRFFLPTTVF